MPLENAGQIYCGLDAGLPRNLWICTREGMYAEDTLDSMRAPLEICGSILGAAFAEDRLQIRRIAA